MSRGKSIIPEFMAKNPEDTFKLLLPLKLKLDEDKHGNSHFEVVIKNMTKNEVFSYELSPELLFTHFPIEKSFSNGKKNDYYKNKNISEKSFLIDTSILNEDHIKKLHNIVDEKSIVSIIGWKRTFLNDAKYINCYLIEQDNIKIIIPHFAIATYYYFRFSEIRESALECNIDSLYSFCDDNRADAKIVLNTPRTEEDAAFIHRFACQDVAKEAFDNVGKYILHYLNYMRRLDSEKEVDSIPIKVTFPVKEKFKIDTKVSILSNEKTNEEFYFVYEILNDFSDIGFEKFTKITERNNFIPDIKDLENLAKVEKEIPGETTEILKVQSASKRYTQTQHQKDRKKSCGSLQEVDIESEIVTKDTIKDLLKIYQESDSEDIIDQSLTESSAKGEKTIRRVVISSEFEKEEKTPLTEIYNFKVFTQYMHFIEQQSLIKDFILNEPKNLPELSIKDTDDINPKCKMKGKARQYLTATFKYENLHVGLLELENYPSSATASWVIVSTSFINDSIFDFFINLYFKENISIPTIAEKYKRTTPRFTKKNHERSELLDNIQLAKWYAGLLGKITLK